MDTKGSIRDKIDAILEAGEIMLNPPDDLAEFIDKNAVKQSRADQILTLISEEIEKGLLTIPETRESLKGYGLSLIHI